MPAVSEAQRRFFIAELIKKQHGKKTKTGLPEHKIKEFLKKKKRSK